jgi:hypothetical protein
MPVKIGRTVAAMIEPKSSVKNITSFCPHNAAGPAPALQAAHDHRRPAPSPEGAAVGGHKALDPGNLERDLSRDTADNAWQAIQEVFRKSGGCTEDLGSRAVLLDIDELAPVFESGVWDPGDFTLHEDQFGFRRDS